MESNTHNTINKIIKDNEFHVYLEVGYKDGMVFNKVLCDTKIGVDEFPRGDEFEKTMHPGGCYLTHDSAMILKMSPGEFFSQEQGQGFCDIIFLNGTENHLKEALTLLSPEGYIVMSECPDQLLGNEFIAKTKEDLLIIRRYDKERDDICFSSTR